MYYNQEMNTLIRLQKYLASGPGLRRGAEKLIAAGRVKINGATVTKAGTKVNPRQDKVEVDGLPVKPAGERNIICFINQPAF